VVLVANQLCGGWDSTAQQSTRGSVHTNCGDTILEVGAQNAACDHIFASTCAGLRMHAV
jgi:hypothetical protein